MNSQPEPESDFWSVCLIENAQALFAFALVLTGAEDRAADLLQDALVAVIRSGIRPQQPKPYLMRAMRNRAAELARRARRKPEWSITDLEAVPDCSTVEHPLADTLWAAVNHLPELSRQIVLLRTKAELSRAEIAEVLELPIGTVTSRYSRALKRLREDLKTEVRHE